MRLRQFALAAAFAAGMAGCAKSGTYVILTVERGPATPAGVVKVDLQLALGGRSGSGTLAGPNGSPINFPAVVTLDVSSGSGPLTVTAIARDASGNEVDHGTGQGTVSSGQTTRMTVTLGEAMMVEDLAGVDFTGADLTPLPDLVEIPDLTGADLAGADLTPPPPPDLAGTDLTGLPDMTPIADMTPKTTATLTVTKSGAAASFATIVGGGVNCGATCSVTVPINTQITLTQSVTARKGAWFQAWSGGGGCTGNASCVITMSADFTVNAQFDLANYMFVLATPISGAIGALATDVQTTANNVCKNAASAASLPGTNWAAWISTTAASASGLKNAKDKLTGARGWIRPDGLPFTDQIPNSTNDAIYYPPRVDQNGAIIGSDQQVATGTLGGNQSGANCTDWSTTSGTTNAGEAAAGSGGWSYSYQGANCTTIRLYCFGLDQSTQVVPTRAAGRVAFLSTAFTMSASTNRGTADGICQANANANPTRVPAGTYQALLPLTTEAASVRFTPPIYTSSLPWVRPDGVVVVNSPGDLFNTNPTTDNLILGPIDNLADGTYGGRSNAWTGATDPNTAASGGSNCSDWVSTGGSNGIFGFHYLARLKLVPSFFNYSFQVNACTVAKPVYCLQVN